MPWKERLDTQRKAHGINDSDFTEPNMPSQREGRNRQQPRG